MVETVRVRFAPSPTGDPHVGNLRTALFNWLYARRHGGKFILRVEDTDRKRYAKGALQAILEALTWLGLDWDEGPEVGGPYAPYFQSQRRDTYQQVAKELVDRGYAYYCYCSNERLVKLRRQQRSSKISPGYDGHCRNLSTEDHKQHISVGTTPVVRFKMPLSGETKVNDLIRGEVAWQNNLLDDFVLLKSDGYPTYHLANVVDDHLMKITHVLRAEEWLSSAPRHLQLYLVLGYEPPLFGHLPMILGPDRAKLSKRHGANSVLQFRSQGFLPEAMVNFMALLGWSLDDKTDVMSKDVLVENFSLDRVGRSGAIFDNEKLEWLNGMYIRQLGVEELERRLTPFLEQGLSASSMPLERDYVRRIVPLVQERMKTLEEGLEKTAYFFQEEIDYDLDRFAENGIDHGATADALDKAVSVLKGLEPFDAPTLEKVLRDTGADLGLSGKQFFGSLRVAVTGLRASPPLFETMVVLGKERCLQRIENAATKLRASLFVDSKS